MNTQELKTTFIQALDTDPHFTATVYNKITENQKDSLVTKEYLNQKVEKLTQAFDEKLNKQRQELEKFINDRNSLLGSRWGDEIEANLRNFTRLIVSQWGGKVRKWKKKVKSKTEDGIQIITKYEIDIVVLNGKTILIEVKSRCDMEDIERFLENVQAYLSFEKPTGNIEKVMFTMLIPPQAKEIAKEENIQIIDPDIGVLD